MVALEKTIILTIYNYLVIPEIFNQLIRKPNHEYKTTLKNQLLRKKTWIAQKRYRFQRFILLVSKILLKNWRTKENHLYISEDSLTTNIGNFCKIIKCNIPRRKISINSLFSCCKLFFARSTSCLRYGIILALEITS